MGETVAREMRVGGGDVGRIGDDEVKTLVGKSGKPVALQKAHRRAQVVGIFSGDSEGGGGKVAGGDLRAGKFQRQTDGDDASAGTQVQNFALFRKCVMRCGG